MLEIVELELELVEVRLRLVGGIGSRQDLPLLAQARIQIVLAVAWPAELGVLGSSSTLTIPLLFQFNALARRQLPLVVSLGVELPPLPISIHFILLERPVELDSILVQLVFDSPSSGIELLEEVIDLVVVHNNFRVVH